jgi:hypothetical protein
MPHSTYFGSLPGGRGVGSRVGSWSGCLTQLFPQWHHLPSRSDELDGLASPYTSLWLIAVCWRDRTSLWGATWSYCDGACQEEEASQGIVIGWSLCPFLIPAHEISQGKWILTRQCLPPGKVMMLLGMLPRCCGIRRRWDRFPLECPMPGAHGLLMLHPVMVGA